MDAHGHDIEIGSPVRYGGTGTKGHVKEIICDSEGAWAMIDTTGLLYRLESLRVLDEVTVKAEMGEKAFTKEEIQESLDKAEEEAKEARLDDANLEAGG